MLDQCPCQRAACLGPDPQRPTVRHRVPATVRWLDNGYVAVEMPGRRGILSETRFLVVGRQILREDAVSGRRGWLDYITDGRSGLDYFRRATTHEEVSRG